jgi:hypothetical protein
MKKAILTTVLAFVFKALATSATYYDVELRVLADIDQVCDFRNNLNWAEEANPELFTGITWGDDGRVVSIDIMAHGIIGKIDFSAFQNLRYLDCSQNLIEWLTVDGLANLEELRCHNNYVQSLDLTGLVSLRYVDCRHNIISSLTIEPNQSIEYFDFTYNNLKSIILHGVRDGDSTIEPSKVQSVYAMARVSAYPQNEATAIGIRTIDETGSADYYTVTGVFVGRFEQGQQPLKRGMYVRKEVGIHKTEAVLIR